VFSAILPPFLGHLLIRGNENVAAWSGCQIADHAGFNVTFGFIFVLYNALPDAILGE